MMPGDWQARSPVARTERSIGDRRCQPYFAARAGTGGLGAKDSPSWQSLIAADVLRIAAAHGEA